MLLTHSIHSTFLTVFLHPLLHDAAIILIVKRYKMAFLCRRGVNTALRAAVLESFGARLLGLDAIGARWAAMGTDCTMRDSSSRQLPSMLLPASARCRVHYE